MPEFIYGPVGFHEDLALIADALEKLAHELGSELLQDCGLPPDDPGLALVREHQEAELEDDVRYHLRLLLEEADHSTQRLRITFVQGESYDFCRVPVQIYEVLMNASAKGTYYNDHIRGRYQCF